MKSVCMNTVHVWLSTKQKVFMAWLSVNHRMQGQQGTHSSSHQCNGTALAESTVGVCGCVDLLGKCVFLFPGVRLEMCVCVSVSVCVFPCEAMASSRGTCANGNSWPHPIISFQSQMSSIKLVISHLFTLSKLEHLKSEPSERLLLEDPKGSTWPHAMRPLIKGSNVVPDRFISQIVFFFWCLFPCVSLCYKGKLMGTIRIHHQDSEKIP